MPVVPSRQEPAIAFLSRLLLAIYLIEAGVLLVMAPGRRCGSALLCRALALVDHHDAQSTSSAGRSPVWALITAWAG